MKLKLDKDIVVFDIESTGLSVSKDRIVELAVIKIFANGNPSLERRRLINPGIPIPESASAIHGITDEMVANEPTFQTLAPGLMTLIGNSDLLTYNGNRFDIPLLMEEFERVGMQLDLTGRRTIDAQRIFHKMEPRTLSAAVSFYLGKKLEGAHGALSDTKATLEVLEAQLEKYKGVDLSDDKGNVKVEPVRNDMDALQAFTNDPREVDFAGKIVLNSENVPVFTFGKLQGKPVGESLAKDEKYLNWIMNGDFTAQTKRIIQRLVNEYNEGQA